MPTSVQGVLTSFSDDVEAAADEVENELVLLDTGFTTRISASCHGRTGISVQCDTGTVSILAKYFTVSLYEDLTVK